MTVYAVKDCMYDSYMAVGQADPIKSDDPLNDPKVAKFITEEDADKALLDWIFPMACKVIKLETKEPYVNFKVSTTDPKTKKTVEYMIPKVNASLRSHLYLRFIREALHYSIEEIADETGLSKWSIVTFENDELFKMESVDIYKVLSDKYISILKTCPTRDLVKIVAKSRLLQYLNEGWFEKSDRTKIGALRH